ncbi:tRNA-(MS[2]IO[6]A)-hydroxylase (MiaE)-like [Arthrobacter sp. cf158]|uniref:ferritin-like fold-containing protein n=1 Tax=Arthrobacter sp. cf158 TaxID=1761744 RepID=UPI0008985DB2|nr:ferritin-like fold-containing protein [Arthrobacter sp. cf158]SDW29133.1 tRNA-(MS[2]IO[6]A)-hydroxylase (MiaE)-like [Arthrobacter sp. cf158]
MGTSPDASPSAGQLAAELLGAMAYGELSAFGRLSFDSRFAPTLHDRSVLAKIAVGAYGNFALLNDRLTEMGIDPEEAMLPFQRSFDHFHERTKPGDWYESVMKAYVIDTVSSDFYRSVSAFLDSATQQFVERVASPDQATEVLRVLLRRALADDPRLASRLAMWGRRLVGEALTQAQRVGMEHPRLGPTLKSGGDARAAIKRLTGELAEKHGRRMTGLGLTA